MWYVENARKKALREGTRILHWRRGNNMEPDDEPNATNESLATASLPSQDGPELPIRRKPKRKRQSEEDTTPVSTLVDVSSGEEPPPDGQCHGDINNEDPNSNTTRIRQLVHEDFEYRVGCRLPGLNLFKT